MVDDATRDPLERFAWHPEPELIGVRDPAARDALDALGRRAWQTALEYLYDEALRRAMGEPVGYGALHDRFFGAGGGPAPAPAGPARSRDVLAEFTRRLAPHQLNSWHPRYMGYFTPPPLMMSIVGELLAQVTQQGVDVWHAGPSAAFVEEEVLRWLCDLVGYGEGSFGVLTSGGVMANFMAMAVCRDIHVCALTGSDQKPRGAALEGWRVYASDQAHFSIARALELLGFPRETLLVVESDRAFKLRAAPVAAAIERDRADGRRPLAIAAVAGSTNSGSIDAIGELADLADAEGLWLHVDAAYGGAARLSAREAARVGPLDRAHSLTIDPHKWFFQAYDIGGLLVRDGRHLAQTFSASPEYYGIQGELDFYKLGFEGTRRWRALKLWLSWKHLGSEGLGRLVESNIDMARHLARRARDSEDFQVTPDDPELSVVCLRHLPGGRSAAGIAPAELDAHQVRLQAALEASGDGWLSTTRLRGSTWLRAGILNYMTTEDDVDVLLARLRDLAIG